MSRIHHMKSCFVVHNFIWERARLGFNFGCNLMHKKSARLGFNFGCNLMRNKSNLKSESASVTFIIILTVLTFNFVSINFFVRFYNETKNLIFLKSTERSSLVPHTVLKHVQNYSCQISLCMFSSI